MTIIDSTVTLIEFMQEQLEKQTVQISSLKKKLRETQKLLKESETDREQAQELARKFQELQIKALRNGK